MSASRARFIAIAALCLAAVGAALIAQYRFDMQPCPWCVLQRVIFIAMPPPRCSVPCGTRVRAACWLAR